MRHDLHVLKGPAATHPQILCLMQHCYRPRRRRRDKSELTRVSICLSSTAGRPVTARSQKPLHLCLHSKLLFHSKVEADTLRSESARALRGKTSFCRTKDAVTRRSESARNPETLSTPSAQHAEMVSPIYVSKCADFRLSLGICVAVDPLGSRRQTQTRRAVSGHMPLATLTTHTHTQTHTHTHTETD